MSNSGMSNGELSAGETFKRAAIVVAVAATPVLIYFLFDLVLIVIGAVLVSILLEVGSEPFRWLRLPRGLSLAFSGIVIIGVLVGAGYLFGTAAAAEMQDVLSRIDAAQQYLTRVLRDSSLGDMLWSHVSNFPLTELFGRIFSVSTNFIVALVVMIFAGIYLAAQPSLYKTGLTKLFPRDWRSGAEETVDAIAKALRLWLFGQLIEMAIIGLMSGLAVWFIGLPSPLALGVIAGVAEFIPYLGPIIAAVPAALVAVTLGPSTVLWTLLAYLAIHQAEGQVIMPVIQRRMVFIPPALMLFSIVAISYAFGLGGTIFAAPITVVLFVLVNKLYVRDALGEQAALPGETVNAAR